jgi:hypothetical protein
MEELLEALRLAVHDLKGEVHLLNKRVESLEIGQGLERRRRERLEESWENGWRGMNGEMDSLVSRTTILETLINEIRARKELIG